MPAQLNMPMAVLGESAIAVIDLESAKEVHVRPANKLELQSPGLVFHESRGKSKRFVLLNGFA